MLMITMETDATMITFRLEGRLAGGGVRELAQRWSAAVFNQPHQRVLLDVAGVTSVDTLGKQFLVQVHGDGNTLVGGVTTTALTKGQAESNTVE